jgi:hypothetical protein
MSGNHQEQQRVDDLWLLDCIDSLSLVACRFVCTTWMRTCPRQGAERQREDWSKQFAAKGWLGVLQWARANGCPWDESTCAQAAAGGHLEVLQ